MKGSRRRYDVLKRTLDLVIASFLIVVTLPVQAIVALMVRINMGSPVLFRQERPGRDGRVFTITKFRTMTEAGTTDRLGSDAERLTRLGRFLRSSSLDELPTQLNVVHGDMSLVGPRPLLVSYLDHYTSQQARRHEVRPGITGLAQVSGRNQLTWAEKFKLDVEYVDRRSLFLDIRILIRTLSIVVRRTGIRHDGHATMDTFTGTPEL